jgi:HD-GYP domain-containing protein (c-di-GMP phosphodiesterase class II)
MSLVPLSTVKHHVRLQEELPFAVLDANGQLLLNRNYRIATEEQLNSLCDRGFQVRMEELPPEDPAQPAAEPARPACPIEAWSSCTARVGSILVNSRHPTLDQALDEASTPVLELVAQDPDFAMLMAMRERSGPKVHYALRHCLHTAIVTRLVAQRLGWDTAAMMSTFKAALTMNLSMMELQSELARSGHSPTVQERNIILQHPTQSRAMLEAGGVRDQDWLLAVEQHHERPDGTGYPLGMSDVDEKARLLRLADSYCAKITPRASRPAMTPDRAGRELFLREATNPMAHALIKELGIYPPGTCVRLASGETGIVLRRGPTMLTPVVAAITWRTGEPRREPLKRDTSLPAFKVLQSVAEQALRFSPPTSALLAVQ